MILFLSLILTIILLPIALIIGTVSGVRSVVKTPKPPDGLTQNELKDYYTGNYEFYLKRAEMEEEEKERQLNRDMETVAHLESQIESLKEIGKALEEDLKYCKDRDKRLKLLSKQITLDNKIYTLQHKLYKLLD